MMSDKLAELLLIMLGSLGLLLTRGIRAHYKFGRPEHHDIEMQMLFGLATIALVILPIVDLFFPWLNFADLPFSAILAWIGLSIGIIAIVFFCSALLASIRNKNNNTLDGGIYRFIRHPLYTALLLWAIAQFFLLQNWLADAAALITFIAMYSLRVPRDEQYLLERFGERYLDYMERTGALWPRWNSGRHH
jgi:protein-S-isoprenylcysteine O-methyltransferase Ste14